MGTEDTIITFIILLAILFIIYARVKNKSLSEVWEEVKDLFTKKPELPPPPQPLP